MSVHCILCVPQFYQDCCTARPKISAPLPNSLVGYIDPTLCAQVLHIAEAQTKSVVQSNGMADDVRRVPAAAIAQSFSAHRSMLPNVFLT